jgi:hypothetical protein
VILLDAKTGDTKVVSNLGGRVRINIIEIKKDRVLFTIVNDTEPPIQPTHTTTEQEGK